MLVAPDERARGLSVAIVCGSASRAAGGIFPIMQAHARQLARLGVDVSVFGIADEFSADDASTWTQGLPRYFAPRYTGFAYAPEMTRALLEAPIDIVHQHGLWLYPSIATSHWRRRRRRPVVISTQGMLEPWALANSWGKKAIAGALFERRNLRQAACLHCSEAEVEGVRRFGLRNPIAVIANGTDLPVRGGVLPRPAWLPDDERRTLLFLGRLHPKKGIRETLDAWTRLKATAPDVGRSWRLVIAGWDDGGHAGSLVSHVQAQGLNNDVVFPGPIFGEQKESVLAFADAFILASYSEGLPMAVLEAWSHALPVFMTRECNLVEGFAAGAAIEVTTDPEKLALTLARSLGSSELARIGQRGRELVEQRFTWDVVVRDLHSVYLWLARGGERPACVVMS